MEKTKGREKVKGQEKETKRDLTWQELTEARQTARDMEGNTISQFLTWEEMGKRFLKDGKTMASHWPILSLGYHLDRDGNRVKVKDSNFKQVTGFSWAEYYHLRDRENWIKNGHILNFSMGGYSNHYIFFLPAPGKEITVKLINGQLSTIKQETILNHNNYLIITNHGRSQHLAHFLGFQFRLYSASPGKAKGKGSMAYYQSNSTTINLQKNTDGHFYLLTKNGKKITLQDIGVNNPYQLLLIILDKGLSFTDKLTAGKDIKNYLK